ncbi:malate dehydrogenase (oxaloacetate-decarboxylating) [Nocardiopsis flavescens]|uniref:Malate dehydrogenase (Oxaloacetate-decarboxylating) n=1 Tax=Nocardiopsis flavescens TaxID=758803 RepID=A0A1M6I7B9_9ACTN|nr:NADP-dependent malic enzyme [Nocardiopsis flavescens]SHJ30340.1 malate dehydrogenase (oxaloacetate-decarboxylating) [Nocardiopsis flavescens]
MTSDSSSHTRNPHLDDDPAFALHRGGKLQVTPTVDVHDHEGLALAYTPGVARVCSGIADAPELVEDYTWRSNLVAVVTDGTAVLGLGDIGPQASLPVMEGKSLLFKQFGGIDSVPIALACTGVDEIVETVVRMAPSFGGINLEDISAPRCFEIEKRLRERLDIPVFHDDQHGTAIVTVAALHNAARLTGRTLGDLRAVVSGAGSAGVAVTKMLIDGGIGDIAVADSKGMVYEGREGLTPVKRELAAISNRAGLRGSIESALAGADVFIGLSAGEVPESVVATMAPDSIVFAMANPNPEIHPDVARKYASVVATGRSDFPNQINNVLAFPGVFRGAFAARATDITENMKLAAATALAGLVGDDLSADHIIPSPFDERVVPAVSAAVAAQAREDGVARR